MCPSGACGASLWSGPGFRAMHACPLGAGCMRRRRQQGPGNFLSLVPCPWSPRVQQEPAPVVSLGRWTGTAEDRTALAQPGHHGVRMTPVLSLCVPLLPHQPSPPSLGQCGAEAEPATRARGRGVQEGVGREEEGRGQGQGSPETPFLALNPLSRQPEQQSPALGPAPCAQEASCLPGRTGVALAAELCSFLGSILTRPWELAFPGLHVAEGKLRLGDTKLRL